MSFTSTTTTTTTTTSPVTSSFGSILKRRVSIDKDGNIVRQLNFHTAGRITTQSESDKAHCKCKCKGKSCAFSEDSDRIVITNTLFFAAALLLSLAFLPPSLNSSLTMSLRQFFVSWTQ